MPRPPKVRRVEYLPEVTLFKPAGVPLSELEEIVLSIAEFEAIRLKDIEGLDQEDCAQRMQVSRTTFQRILTISRQKIAAALVNGGALKIEGGSFKLAMRKFQCEACGEKFERPFGTGKRGHDMQCPSCGKKSVHRLR